MLIGSADAPADGRLSGLATFQISLDGALPVSVSVPRDVANAALDDLVTDINSALALTSLKGKVTAGRSASRITLTSPTGTGLVVTAEPTNPAATQLFLVGTGAVTQWNKSVFIAGGAQVRLNGQITTNTLTAQLV